MQLKMDWKAVLCEIVNTISVLIKEELETILINISKNRNDVVFG